MVEDDWGQPSPSDWDLTEEEMKRQDQLYERDMEMNEECESTRKVNL